MANPLDVLLLGIRRALLDSGKSRAASNWLGVVTRMETRKRPANPIYWKEHIMNFNKTIQQAGATGYILLWLLGIPIPILLLIFLLRGCT